MAKSRYSRKNKGKKLQRVQENTVSTEEKSVPEVETIDFNGFQIPKVYDGKLERKPMELEIKKGFVEGMNGDAKIFCNDDLFNLLTFEMIKDISNNYPSCVRQTANAATLPGVVASLAMPDAHSGYGFSIGGVVAMRLDNSEAVICPGGVGFDINCGVRLIRTNLQREDIEQHKSRLADELFKQIPSGVGTKAQIAFSPEDFDSIMTEGLEFLVKNGYAWEEDLSHCEEHGKIANADPSLVSKSAKSRGYKQVGTLGSGNHYLEVQVVDEIMDVEAAKAMGINEVGQVCIMVHCGSRGLGHQVCQDYIDLCMKSGICNPIDKQLTGVPFNSPIGQQYYSAMNCCANFAFANRGMITYRIRQAFETVLRMKPKKMDMHLVYDVCHNIAKVEEHEVDNKKVQCIVHRKGATRAFPPQHPDISEDYKEIGQPAIIGGSMGTCSYVLVGTQEGMKKSFGSTCHGAGRKMSRVKAMDNLTSKDVINRIKEMGIELRITDPKLAAEEADEAYKDVTEVVETCQAAGISKIVLRLKPLIVIKG
ncbi:hypothetical protein, conserved [Entamoeba dispar SAW760]|uniref:RNA-splicing ligase RtcB homolog 1 n=1 Tax=Entamoeba dispar (strain ATCC PRA-260 / SAW760) TaxID=370354 RepID=RTCB1_ENTDS|nr:uncharacterized protein EDI_022970 [Entamoeba dispar SAW760]B0EAV2.1 RecName: Full=RNA-splicing ligase RtcB homolog 1; AltName: Full=3'-phosphate/5'-hydroxy nucleic acid ligase 1 [Entamoeba dispar SAW760]EDR28341.1 hypothetical protein, conserved [Entamoeba dispar SAW760]|eukprot:EDR28341.1 hypothetical protein, conserved [Entamoeba dispar SAW760]